ncbi:alpha/beta fold hydrolase [Perlucidibaca piscinae]|uniref:alpha/beta fold hydrolase n=1 Tax=Perlucidibaca piscinae TaxID=392589 RepID=UPI0003B377CF|nr:alpha/beta fold hydrolase [Perlucidibaca piscinae]
MERFTVKEGNNLLEREFITAVGPAYLARARAPDPERVRRWRYRSFLPLLNRLHGTVTGLSSRHGMIAGQRVVWLEGGNRAGEAVVLVHGFGASKENWLPLLPFLARRYHLFLIDLPGWGESQFDASARYGMDDQVARLASWMQHVLDRPAHVVGSSMGGGVAGLLAARHPAQVRTVTLMNAAGVAGVVRTPFEDGLAEGRNGLIAHNARGVFDLLATVMSSRALAMVMAPGMYWDLVSRRHVNEHLFRQLMENEPDPELAAFSGVEVPTLVLWGVDDQVLHVTCADTFRQLIPQAQVKLLHGIGHLPMVETPRVTARAMRKFWRGSGSS